MPSPYVLLSHNSGDKPQVIRLARALMERGVRVWLDIFELRPNQYWGPALDEAVDGATVVLACVGEHGKGPWHDRELMAARARDIDTRLVCLPGWTVEKGRLGLDDRLAYDLAADWDLVVERLAIELSKLAPMEAKTLGAATTLPFHGSPYPGIDRLFEAEHAAWFFGREDETARIIRDLTENRWVWLVGNSGSGKSSVARAGVMSWWPRHHDVRGVAAVFEPTNKPLQDLAGALLRACGDAGNTQLTSADFKDDPGQGVRDAFGGTAHPPPVLLVVDQGEQIFGEDGLKDGCDTLMTRLWDLCHDKGIDVRVLFVLRADWVHRALPEKSLEPILEGSKTRYALPSMTAEALRNAIVIPAQRAGGGVEEFVVRLLADGVHRRQHGLPLLQFILRDAWHRTDTDRTIRSKTLSVTPFEDAIGNYVRARKELSEDDLDRLVLALVELDDRDAPRRRLLTSAGDLQPLLDELVDARIVVASETGWQLAHEAVLSEWHAFADAITRRRDLLRLVAGLERRRSDRELLQGGALEKYRPLLAEPSLTDEQRHFMEQSIEADARQDAERRERERKLRESHARHLIALAAKEEPRQRVLLLAEVTDEYAELVLRHVGLHPIGEVPIACYELDVAISVAAFSPDGCRVLVACDDGTLRLWPSDGSGRSAHHRGASWPDRRRRVESRGRRHRERRPRRLREDLVGRRPRAACQHQGRTTAELCALEPRQSSSDAGVGER